MHLKVSEVLLLALLEVVQESLSNGDFPGFRRSVCTVYICLLAHPSETTAPSIVPSHSHYTHAHTHPTIPPHPTLSSRPIPIPKQLRQQIPVCLSVCEDVIPPAFPFVCSCIRSLFVRSSFRYVSGVLLQRKKIINDQELIQSDPTSCPQNQKGK